MRLVVALTDAGHHWDAAIYEDLLDAFRDLLVKHIDFLHRSWYFSIFVVSRHQAQVPAISRIGGWHT